MDLQNYYLYYLQNHFQLQLLMVYIHYLLRTCKYYLIFSKIQLSTVKQSKLFRILGFVLIKVEFVDFDLEYPIHFQEAQAEILRYPSSKGIFLAGNQRRILFAKIDTIEKSFKNFQI